MRSTGWLQAAVNTEHGKNLYIYHHLSTQQTVYSLYRSMNNHEMLKQIPFLGKKTKPPALRKDMWKPLATVTFPTGLQGLSAYKRLREYRRVRMTSQPLSSLPEKTNTNKKPDHAEYSSKPSNPLANPTKKWRQKLLMDQKATSIADLAAVLKGQESMGADLAALAREKEEAEVKRQESMWEEYRTLAALGETEIQKIEEHIEVLETRKAGKEPKGQAKLAGGIMVLRMKRNKIKRAMEELKKRDYKESQTAEIAARDAKLAAEAAAREVEEAKLEASNAPETPEMKATKALKLKTFGPTTITLESLPATKHQPPLPKYGIQRKQRLHPSVPVMKMDGVKIRWANILDADFAAEWPEAVHHEDMGLVRHTAAKPWETPKRIEDIVLESKSELEQKFEDGELELDGEANEEGGKEEEGKEAEKEGEKEQEDRGDGKGKGDKEAKKGGGKGGLLGRLLAPKKVQEAPRA